VTRVAKLLRERWEALAARTGLRFLPPVPTVLLVLAAGVLVPFVAPVDALPTQFAPSLAQERLARFRAAHPTLPEAGPLGSVYSKRPAFFWPAHADADHYSLRVLRSDGTEQVRVDMLRRPFHLIQPPGGLEPGASYRFEVVAFVAGEALPWQEHSFAIRPEPEDLGPLLASLRLGLGTEESAYVLLGYYADKQSPHDVVSAFLHWKACRGELGSLGAGPWTLPQR
jgi:hypothetical protein